MRVLLVAVNSKYIHTALGVRSVCAYCRAAGENADFLEQAIQTPLLTTLAQIADGEPEVIGLDVHIWNAEYVYALVELVHKVLPRAIIVLGGPEVAFSAKKAWEQALAADYIISGEGEEPFAELLQELKTGVRCSSPAILRKGEVNNEECGAVVADLDSLPFPYADLAELSGNGKIIYYEASRGCPYACSYCLSGLSKKVRRKSLPKVLSELQLFLDAKVPLVKFVDRTFNLDERYYLPIFQFLAAAETETVFHFEIKADLLPVRVLDYLATIPCNRFQFEIGIQSIHKATLREINRAENRVRLEENVLRLRADKRIHLHTDLIIGLPLESYDDFIKSFNHTYDLRAQELQLGFLKILKGAAINEKIEEYGIIYSSLPPYEVVETKWLPYRQIKFLKVLEEVFSFTYNSGKFNYFLDYIVQKHFQCNAFAFYQSLTEWWLEKKLFPGLYGPQKIAQVLKAFSEQAFPEDTMAVEVLRFDVFLAQANYRQQVFTWHNEEIRQCVENFWRIEERVGKYLPGYRFESWGKVRKYYPIERFDFNPENGKISKTFVLAKHTGKITEYSLINPEDLN